MMFSDRRTVLVTIMLTLIGPKMCDEFHDHSVTTFNNNCQYSACEINPSCVVGFESISTIDKGCSFFGKKNYCCLSGMGPQCFHTDCSTESSCSGNYRELDRTGNGCPDFDVKAYCCKTTNLPSCFDLECPAPSELAEPKACPPEYKETKRSGCDRAFHARITCCLSGENNRTRIPDFEVISERKTITPEDGCVQTITTGQTNVKSGGFFSNGYSSYAAFFKILLFVPLLTAIFVK